MRTFTFRSDPLTSEVFCEVNLRGEALLRDTYLNKGSAFAEEERQALGLTGLLRSAVCTLDQQCDRVMENYRRRGTDLERYINLSSVLDRNETLYYRVLGDHLEEMLPIVYTPTVGEACLQMSHITRHFRGVYVSPDNIGQIDRIFRGLTRPQTSLIVVTDGERILGLGDLGSDGMGIPVGKIALYVAAAGLHPTCCLPICLDVGTNNRRLLEDPLYLGHRRPRLTGQAYDDFVERFVLGVQRNFPGVLLQWEDFAKHTAFRLLDRYRQRILSFDDDIQGTGATALAALLTAERAQERRLEDQKFVLVGMGQAGVGAARCIRAVLTERGLSEEDVRRRILAVDAPGLLVEGHLALEEPQRPFAQRRDAVAGWTLESPDRIGLLDVVKNSGASVLVGVTACPGLFDEKVLGQLAKNAPRPVVLALSNPTAKCECTPADVARATDGRGLIATGSPFVPFEWNGRRFAASQCNNLYIFPGMGLGLLVAHATQANDTMFLAASRAISSMVTREQEAEGLLLPVMADIRRVSREVARAVAVTARDQGLGSQLPEEELVNRIARAQWEPRYLPYRPGPPAVADGTGGTRPFDPLG